MPSATRVFLTVFLDLIGFGIVLPLLPSYGARFTTSAALIGALVATDSLLTFLLAPRWGRLSDRIGRRPVLLIGLAGSAVSYLVFGLAGSFAALLLSRIISGATGATVHVAQAYLADITPPERRSHAMGLIGAAFGLGFTVGPAIGGSASLYGEALPGLIASGIAAANFLLALFTLPETEVRRRPDYRPLPLSWARFGSPFGVMFASTLAFTAIYVSFPLYSQNVLGYGRSAVSSFFVVIGLITIVVQGRLVGKLAPKVGERRLVIGGSLLMAAGFGLFPLLSHTTGGLITSIALLTTGFCLVGPSLAGLVSRNAAREEQGGALGMLQSV
ncbi:MAG TPA: MFS transporter, partial [Gemmatimonadales bacterium]|nr:MFS transporter [Gemmatimonadales bacterium]